MIGMIKKDIIMLRNNIKILLVAFLIYILLSFSNELANAADILFVIPFMTVTTCISLFSYDDFNHWHAYAATLPDGRRNAVKGKYIATVLLTLIVMIICVLLSWLIGHFKSTLNIEETLRFVVDNLLSMLIIIAILFPIYFKYGAEKARVILFVGTFALFGIVLALTRIVKIDISENLGSSLESYGLIIISIISLVVLFISYKISERIYLRKDF